MLCRLDRRAGALAGWQFGDGGLPEPVVDAACRGGAVASAHAGQRHGGAWRGADRCADELRRLLHQFRCRLPARTITQTLQALREVAASSEAPTARRRGRAAAPRVAGTQHAAAPGRGLALDDQEDAIDLEEQSIPICSKCSKKRPANCFRSSPVPAPVGKCEDSAPRSSVLRTLHTLKGMHAGRRHEAGERAHRMESEIECWAAATCSAPTSALAGPIRRDAGHVRRAACRRGRGRGRTGARNGTRRSDPKSKRSRGRSRPRRRHHVAEVAAEREAAERTEGVAGAERRRSAPRGLPTPSTLATAASGREPSGPHPTPLLDRLVAQSGEVIHHARSAGVELGQLRSSLHDLPAILIAAHANCATSKCRPRARCQSRLAQAKDSQQGFDPLEFDRFTRVQELTR